MSPPYLPTRVSLWVHACYESYMYDDWAESMRHAARACASAIHSARFYTYALIYSLCADRERSRRDQLITPRFPDGEQNHV